MSRGDSDQVIYGSGFFVRPDVVATNYHVVKDGIQGYVKLVGQEIKLEIAGLAGLDRSNDLALLKLRRSAGAPLKVVNNVGIGVGDQIFVVGNPKGLEGTFSAGLVSSIRKEGSDSLLQITAPISPGSSGGPVLNDQGEVVGVAVGGIAEGQSLNFAIPSSYLLNLLNKSAALLPLAAASSAIGGGSRGEAGGGRMTASRPRMTTGPAVITRRIAKKTDLEKDELVGQVKSIKVENYKFVEKFGKWQRSDVWQTELSSYDPRGFKEYEEGYNYKDWFGLSEIAEPPGEWEPSRYKRVISYDYEDRAIAEDLYWAPLTERILEYRSRQVETYDAGGELADSSDYDPDGTLKYKWAYTVDSRGRKARTWYNASGSVVTTNITYTDESGAGVSEDYNKSNKLTHRTRTSKTVTPDSVIEVIEYFPEDTISKWVTVSDPRNGLEIEKTAFLGDEVINKFRNEYKFDGRGNWVGKTAYRQVSKFGRTYFEPYELTVRSITYHSDAPSRPARRR
jgi:hypothetical protein